MEEKDRVYQDITIDNEALMKLVFTNVLVLEQSGAYSLVKQTTGWFDGWYEMWPRKVKSGGYLIRSDKNSCMLKMIKFRKSNPTYTPEIILKATENYLTTFRRKEYAYVQKADYFIYKDGASTLYSYCDEVTDSLTRPAEPEPKEFTKHI